MPPEKKKAAAIVNEMYLRRRFGNDLGAITTVAEIIAPVGPLAPIDTSGKLNTFR
jgi:hypothetical protein